MTSVCRETTALSGRVRKAQARAAGECRPLAVRMGLRQPRGVDRQTGVGTSSAKLVGPLRREKQSSKQNLRCNWRAPVFDCKVPVLNGSVLVLDWSVPVFDWEDSSRPRWQV